MKNKLIILTIFAIAMACLESAVVVYIRELYFSNGFSIQYVPIKFLIIKVEIIREVATIIMLYTISCIMTDVSHKRFAWFIYAFAVWDIFYYVWLKVFLDWPNSILDLDILFLLPVTWLGPVLAPVICSLAMILLALAIIHFNTKLKNKDWLILSFGSIFILYSFMYDYGKMIIENEFYKSINTLLTNPLFAEKASQIKTIDYQWSIFIIGILMICFVIMNYTYRNQYSKNEN